MKMQDEGCDITAGLKELGPQDIRETAFQILEKAAREKPGRVLIESIGGYLQYIRVYGQEMSPATMSGIFYIYDSYNNVEYLQITPFRLEISCYTQNREPRNILEIIGDLKKSEEIWICANARVIKKFDSNTYLMKLADRLFLIKAGFLGIKEEGDLSWLLIYTDRDRELQAVKIYCAEDKDILSLLL